MISTLGDILAQLGQVAAIILAIYLFVTILIGLALTAAFMFATSWLGEKASLIKKLRPNIDSMNAAIKYPEASATLVGAEHEAKLIQVVHAVQSVDVPQRIEGVREQAQNIEQKVNHGADRVAETVIELRARTVQAQRVLRAFFLPGLTGRHKSQLPAASEHERILAIPPVTSAEAVGTPLVGARQATGVESTGHAPHA